MAFKELDEWFDSSLKLPIKGKVYRIESVDAATGVWCQRLMSVAVQASSGKKVSEKDVASLDLDDDQELDLYQRTMGDTYAEMVDDGIPWEWIKHAGTTTLLWIANGTDAAEAFWNAGGNPEAQRLEPQDRKAPARKGRQGSRGGSTSQQPTTVKGELVTPGETSSSTGT